MTRTTTRPAAILAVAAIVGAMFFLLAPASTAAPAQTCPPGQVPSPPYGCIVTTTTTATPPGTGLPECIFSRPTGPAGVTVDVTITNVPAGITVALFINNQQVDSAVATSGDDDAAASLVARGAAKSGRSAKSAGVAAQTGLVDVEFSFVVPVLPAGQYQVFALGPNFRCDCFPFTVTSAAVGGTNTSRGGGDLARTGFTVLGLLIIAAVLLLAGRAMVESGRRRKTA